MLAASLPFTSMNMTSNQQHDPHAAAQVAEKVMRRVEIAKVARNLHDCLAFASFKAQHGWQDRTLSAIEPEVTEKLARRKRPHPDDSGSTDGSSPNASEEHRASSSREGPNFYNDLHSYRTSRKRARASSVAGLERSQAGLGWEDDHRLSRSSPVLEHPPAVNSSYAHLQDSPMFDVSAAASDEEDHDLAMHNAREPASSVISSSPPRTPPPARRSQKNSKQTGADLLLYLANSPRSPAVHVQHISSSSKNPPATPPSQRGHLPSSFMQTPGTNTGLFNEAVQTPGNLNFADFCNVTPSPAQAQWGTRTPALSRTPGRFARRSLNFDTLLPPSPTTQRKAGQGLALELGEELVPRSS